MRGKAEEAEVADEVKELREEVARLRAENEQLREQLAQAMLLIAKLQAELERVHTDPPPRIKPNTPKPQDGGEGEKKPRGKRAKEPKSTMGPDAERYPHR